MGSSRVQAKANQAMFERARCLEWVVVPAAVLFIAICSGRAMAQQEPAAVRGVQYLRGHLAADAGHGGDDRAWRS